jgi:hypothetical protein
MLSRQTYCHFLNNVSGEIFMAEITNFEALRMAEGSIFIAVEVVKFNSRSTLAETHIISDNSIIVNIEEIRDTGMGTMVTGKGRIQFKVWNGEANINSIEYVVVNYKNDSCTANL